LDSDPGLPFEKMTREESIEKARELNRMIREVLNIQHDCDIGGRLLIAYTHIAVTHHSAIIELSEARHDPSALALLRPLVESCLRGLWIYDRPEEALVAFLSGKRLSIPGLETLVTVLSPRFPDGLLAPIKKNYGTMYGFTHTGYEQIAHMIDGIDGAVRQAYPESVVAGAVGNATSTLVIHMLAFCYLFGLRNEGETVRLRFNFLFSGKARNGGDPSPSGEQS
jgi:hypothetical protein